MGVKKTGGVTVLSELKYWLWLSSLVWLRPRAKVLLLNALGGAREIYFAAESELKELDFLSEREVAMLSDKSLESAKKIADACESAGISILTLRDAAYPRRLAGIYDPPAVLYVRGRLPAVDELAAVAVVGTRKATPYGLKMATRLGYELTRCGGLVVSGLTAGVDSAAARGALMAGGRCIGVLGTPIDAGGKSAELAGDVALTGAVVSEYPPGARQHGSFFRARNRISAGLSVAAVVVEAPAKSGALLFANEAMSQGREIFAVPGNADSPNSVGTNDLLMDGAIPATGGWDILCGFERRYPGLADPGGPRRRMPEEREVESLRQESVSHPAEPQPEPETTEPEPYEPPDISELLKDLDETQLALVRAIDGPSVHIDKIAERSGLPMNTVLKELTMLQLMGVVTMVSYKCFALAAPD